MKAVVAGVIGRSVLYMCWGIPSGASGTLSYRLRLYRLRLMLRFASRVLVNEAITRADVERISGRKADMVPYLVDTDYFQFANSEKRDEYIVVPGNNGRNEELVRLLCHKGFKVVRATSSDAVVAFHKSAGVVPNLDVRQNISFSSLRELYQRAAAVALPLAHEHHAAGQTAMLESIACGAPVAISAGRTGTIGEKFPSVFQCKSAAPEAWCALIDKAIDFGKSNGAALEMSADQVRQHHHPRAVENALVDIFRSTFAEQNQPRNGKNDSR